LRTAKPWAARLRRSAQMFVARSGGGQPGLVVERMADDFVALSIRARRAAELRATLLARRGPRSDTEPVEKALVMSPVGDVTAWRGAGQQDRADRVAISERDALQPVELGIRAALALGIGKRPRAPACDWRLNQPPRVGPLQPSLQKGTP